MKSGFSPDSGLCRRYLFYIRKGLQATTASLSAPTHEEGIHGRQPGEETLAHQLNGFNQTGIPIGNNTSLTDTIGSSLLLWHFGFSG
ncbi:hypothetical protein [Methyloterricola oryzae]|uniref:hypothetical protein n=1 Tax=Methyloterricola oryzae TaxID=1495050 RepID=UPI0011AEE278|nr:hypothetical protein [Methyloterricola oryzae]